MTNAIRQLDNKIILPSDPHFSDLLGLYAKVRADGDFALETHDHGIYIYMESPLTEQKPCKTHVIILMA